MSYILLKSLNRKHFTVSNEMFEHIFDMKKLEKYEKRDKHDIVLKHKRKYYYIKLSDLDEVCRVETITKFLKLVFKYSHLLIANNMYVLVISDDNELIETQYTLIDKLALFSDVVKYVMFTNDYTYNTIDAIVVLDDSSKYEFISLVRYNDRATFYSRNNERVEFATSDEFAVLSVLDKDVDELRAINYMIM